MGDSNLVIAVDDDPIINRIIEGMLSQRHVRVMTTTSASGALSLLNEHRERVRLILLDLAMPGLSGFDFCRMVRAQPEFAKLPIVAVTGVYTDTTPRESAEAGIDEVLPKPFTSAQLEDILRRYHVINGS